MDALSRLFPQCAVTAFAGTHTDKPELYAVEAEAVHRAVPSRQHEFAEGRACARRALQKLGVGAIPIPVGPDRAPVWPEGIVGSITHCRGFTGAVVAPTTCVDGIGFDAEPAQPLQRDLHGHICTPEEVSWFATAPAMGWDWAKLIFSAKESVHKCVQPRHGVTLDFLDVTLDFTPYEGAFGVRQSAAGNAAEGIPLHMVRGRFVVTDTHLFTSAFIDRP